MPIAKIAAATSSNPTNWQRNQRVPWHHAASEILEIIANRLHAAGWSLRRCTPQWKTIHR
jgi:hypothetical protein